MNILIIYMIGLLIVILLSHKIGFFDKKQPHPKPSNTLLSPKLQEIHSKLKIKYGSLLDELPEQEMAIKYIKKDSKVLELGGNIGRNSLVIASILDDDKNLVVLESDTKTAKQLSHNRNLNKMNFHVETGALSKTKLMQQGGGLGEITVIGTQLKDGYNWVDNITVDELNKKYKLKFDTLVIDCEGCLYSILKEMPELLTNITTIIMENDYTDEQHKIFINKILKENLFTRVYGSFEVWQKQK